MLPTRPRVKVRCSLAQYASSSSLMNSLPLSVSIPSMGKGNSPRAAAVRARRRAGFVQKRQAFRPGRGDVGQREGVQECAFQAAATVGDQVAFEKAWLDVVPFGERADRDLLLEQAPRLRGREPMRLAEGPKQTIRRGRAECQLSDGKTSAAFRRRVRRHDVARSTPAANGSYQSRVVASAPASGVRAFDAACPGYSR